MEKMTVRDLQCKLYIENLLEEYKNRDFMFTTICEKEKSRIICGIEKKVKEIEEKEALSDEELKGLWENKYESIGEIREDLRHSKEYFRGDFLTRFLQDCIEQDFTLALLFMSWKERFASENTSDAAIIDSYILHELAIDSDKICAQVLKDFYTEYLCLNKRWHVLHYKDELNHIISSYDGWDGKDALEIDTDFFGKSTKIITKKVDYLVLKVLRDLTGTETEVYRFKDMSQVPDENSFRTIVAKLSSCKDQSFDGIMGFFNSLVARANKICGRIILIDSERLLASDSMYEFRKKMIEESLLEIHIGGSSLFADIYILRAHSAAENVLFNFVNAHQHSAAVSDNFLTLHNKLSKSDVESIDYNFSATSDLLTGQKGIAYSFRDLFSVPKTGVEEKKISGVFHVFQMKDMPHDFVGAVKNWADLDEIEISGSFNVLTESKLVFFIGDEKIQCCYIEASSEHPVIVGRQFAVLDLNTEILCPEYMQALCAKGTLEKVFDGEFMKREQFRYTDCDYDPYVGEEFFYTPEKKILSISTMIQIPSLEMQRKEILDAQFINASAVEREKALEMLLAEKTWLNEEHIRNIKHRIGNELLPIKNDIDAMVKLLARHPEGITLDTIRGKDEKVSEILDRLTRCISRVNESLQDLTRTVDKGNLKPVDIVGSVQDFVKDIANNQTFKADLKVPCESININGSKNMINSILRNIVDNAIRHGFVDKSRDDYAIEFAIGKDGNGNCVLDVKNNGTPMSELARDSYFKRGSVAGTTGHSGIGGADVKDTANAMGGDVTLPVNEDGWSVCVRISLPIFNSEKI